MKTEAPFTRDQLLAVAKSKQDPDVTNAYCLEIRSPQDVTGNLNSQFKYNQSTDGPYQEMTKDATNNRYLEKIAKAKEEHQKFKPLHALGATFLGGFAGIPMALGSQGIGKVMMRDAKSTSHNSDNGTIKKMIRDNKLDVTFNTREHIRDKATSSTNAATKGFTNHVFNQFKGDSMGPGYFHGHAFGAKKNLVGGVKMGKGTVNKDIIMHELGHAKDYKTLGKTKMFMRTIGTKALGGASLAALSHEKTRDYSVPLAVASTLSTLRDEAAANYHAHKAIKVHKGAPAANRFLKDVAGKNMMNYGLAAGATVAGSYAAKKLMDKWHPKKGTGK